MKCTPANSQLSSRVFIEGRSYFPELRPKNIFSMIMILCSMLLLKINSSSKKIMFFNGEFFKKICNRNSTFLLRFIHNMLKIVLFPWTTATMRIHLLSGRILNITTDGKRPYVKAKVNGYGRNFLYDTGASRTCMTMNTFKNAFPNGTPRKLRTNSRYKVLLKVELG